MAPEDVSLQGVLVCSVVVMAGGGRGAAPTPAPERPGVTNGSDGTRLSPAHDSAQSAGKALLWSCRRMLCSVVCVVTPLGFFSTGEQN